jgi:hypothetical protein
LEDQQQDAEAGRIETKKKKEELEKLKAKYNVEEGKN